MAIYTFNIFDSNLNFINNLPCFFDAITSMNSYNIFWWNKSSRLTRISCKPKIRNWRKRTINGLTLNSILKPMTISPVVKSLKKDGATFSTGLLTIFNLTAFLFLKGSRESTSKNATKNFYRSINKPTLKDSLGSVMLLTSY